MLRRSELEVLRRLSPAERLRLFDEILDSLATEDGTPIPDWLRTELDARLADPAEQATISPEELKRRLR